MVRPLGLDVRHHVAGAPHSGECEAVVFDHIAPHLAAAEPGAPRVLLLRGDLVARRGALGRDLSCILPRCANLERGHRRVYTKHMPVPRVTNTGRHVWAPPARRAGTRIAGRTSSGCNRNARTS